ncbi:hypothetical protein M3Y99_00318200 [Aphelenchoides fujianensis]|nr:hypothetical protein M3Y99_00318200 [Aphelenchoides fujianensis]
MAHYYPPKNFTEGCWKPHMQVGVISCRSACFTIVEEVYDYTNQEAVMRGCMDRFLLFGLDADIKKAISNLNNRACRTMDRELLNLVSLSQDIPLVLMCSCVGNLCNSDEVQNDARSQWNAGGSTALLLFLLHLARLFVSRVIIN